MYDSDNGYSVMRDALKEEIYSKEVHRLTETTKVSVAVTGRKRALFPLIRLVVSLECFIEIT